MTHTQEEIDNAMPKDPIEAIGLMMRWAVMFEKKLGMEKYFTDMNKEISGLPAHTNDPRVVKLNKYIRANNYFMGLLHVARELWPDTDDTEANDGLQ